jgi:hypothetical protein
MNFRMDGISDSEYGADEETRISVFGYEVYFCEALIAWKSKACRSVTLSSTEADITIHLAYKLTIQI